MADARGSSHRGVLVCEPQFRGSTHATFNAGLLAAAAYAFPGAPLGFAAHPSHQPWVRRALPPGEPAAARAIELPELPSLRRVGRRRRTAAEVRVWLGVLARARRERAQLLLFTSTTKLGALFLKLACRAGSPPVLAVVHQLFELEAPAGGRRTPSLASVLALPQPRRLAFVAPSSATIEALARRRPRLARHFVALEPPYFWQRDEVAEPSGGGVGFALFGTAGAARLAPFLDLARRVGPAAGARFRVVGHVPEAVALSAEDAALLGRPARRPLPLDELARIATAVDFAVWLGGEDYELRLSASFLDALSWLRPLVALRTPFAEHYFHQLGDIGVLCADHEAMGAVVAGLAAHLPAERHRAWGERMRVARQRFEPAAVASSLLRAVPSGGPRS